MAIRPTDSNVTDELRKADRGSGILPLCRQRDDGHDLGLAARRHVNAGTFYQAAVFRRSKRLNPLCELAFKNSSDG